MTKTSRKVLPARKRTDHGVGFRISTAEKDELERRVKGVERAAGYPITVAAYSKHAALEHSKLLDFKTTVIELVKNRDPDLGIDIEGLVDLIDALARTP